MQICNALEGHCPQAMKIGHSHVNDRLDYLISGHRSLNPSKEAISLFSRKYKRCKFVHRVLDRLNWKQKATKLDFTTFGARLLIINQ